MKKILLTLAALFLAGAAFSQSADEVTKIIESDQVTFGQVCYLTAVYNNLVDENASETDAMNAWFEKNQLQNSGVSPETAITYKDACYYFSKMWNIKGSLLFRISKGSPRYAYRQLKNDGLLPASADPSKKLSGTDLLNIYTIGNMKYVGELEAAE